MNKHEFRDAVETYCSLTGGSVTSYGRTPLHNKAVGGVGFSAHQFWLAVDVTYDATQPEPWRKETARRLGLKLISESDHDHLQPLTWDPN